MRRDASDLARVRGFGELDQARGVRRRVDIEDSLGPVYGHRTPLVANHPLGSRRSLKREERVEEFASEERGHSQRIGIARSDDSDSSVISAHEAVDVCRVERGLVAYEKEHRVGASTGGPFHAASNRRGDSFGPSRVRDDGHRKTFETCDDRRAVLLHDHGHVVALRPTRLSDDRSKEWLSPVREELLRRSKATRFSGGQDNGGDLHQN
jgi:hypothetical protein